MNQADDGPLTSFLVTGAMVFLAIGFGLLGAFALVYTDYAVIEVFEYFKSVVTGGEG